MSLSLDVLRGAYLAQLDLIENASTVLQPSNKAQLDVLRTAAKSPTLTLTQLSTLINVPVDNQNVGFHPLHSLANIDPMSTTCFNFGTSLSDWYFYYGQTEQFAFTFVIFALPTASPQIANKLNIPSQSLYIYTVGFGYAEKGKPWVTMPQVATLANYVCISPGTFDWNATPDTTSILKTCRLSSPTLGRFELSVTWGSGTTTHSLTATLVSTKPPTYNGPNGCMPACTSGIGSLYWSYTDMVIVGQVNQQTQSVGTGWMDHQWIASGKLANPVLASVRNVSQMFGNLSNKTTRWLWLNIQDKINQKQYMLYIPLTDSLVRENQRFSSSKFVTNEYDDNGVRRTSDVDVTVNNVIKSPDGYVWPTKYTIRIGKVTYVLQSLTDLMTIYNTLGVLSWEGSGTLTDIQGKNMGYSFIEANFTLPTKNITSIMLQSAGISNDDKMIQLFTLQRPRFSQSVLSTFIIGLIIAVTILAIVFLWKGTKRALNKRCAK